MRVPFSGANKGFNIWDVEQLKLKKDEIARICCIDEDAEVGWAHWVFFGEGHKQNGYYQCFGDYALIFGVPGSGRPGQGADPENCPFCRVQARDSHVGIVGRRFGTNLIKYTTDVKGIPRKPYSGDIIVWRFGDDKYNRLADIRDTFGDPKYGIRALDLQVKCTQEQYQRFDIDPLRECLWQTDPAFGKAILGEWKEKRQPDLSGLLATPVKKERAEQMVAEAMGVSTPGVAVPATAGADPAQLAKLLDESMPVPAQQPLAPPPVQMPLAPPQQPIQQPIPPAAVPHVDTPVTFIGPTPGPSAPIPTSVAPINPPATAPVVPNIQNFDELLKTK